MRRQKWLAKFGSRARAMRPGRFLPEATPVKHSPAGTLTLVPAYPPRNRPASTWRKPSRQRNVDETWPATARGVVFLRLYRPRSTSVSHRPVRSFISIAIVPRSPFLVLLPTHSSFLLNPTSFSAQAPFFLIPFAEGRIRCGGFPALKPPIRKQTFSFFARRRL